MIPRPDTSVATDPVREFRGPAGGVLTCDAVITPMQVLRPGWVHITDDTVTAVGAGQPSRPPVRRLPPGSVVIPGLVDTHVHGGGGHSMTLPDPHEVAAAAAYHLQHGTTAVLVSLVTTGLAHLHDSLALVADLTQEGPGARGRILGSHLEGPYLSPARRGVHPADALRRPKGAEVAALVRSSRDTLRMVTFAPELDGALGAGGLVSQLRTRGVTAAVGHTDASYEVTRQALTEGASTATHLFNGMRPILHRDPGPITALLQDHTATCELINDGIHVHPAVATLTVALLGAGRLVLITDAVAATGAQDGTYTIGETSIVRHNGSIRTADDSSLGGSDLTLAEALRRAVAVLGMPLADAVAAATCIPAAAVGAADAVGSLTPGRPADLVVLDEDVRIQAVMASGAWVRPPIRRGEPPESRHHGTSGASAQPQPRSST